jgi:proteasome lid subunit RPN8/RPN11
VRALAITGEVLEQIRVHGAEAYPEEGAGFLLGVDGEQRRVVAVLPLANRREDPARHNRYLISPGDYLRAEDEAERRGLSLVGVFHSHPDHPAQPSGYDREHAQPWFSYLITSVEGGRALDSRSWRLAEDRAEFSEEQILLVEQAARTKEQS